MARRCVELWSTQWGRLEIAGRTSSRARGNAREQNRKLSFIAVLIVNAGVRNRASTGFPGDNVNGTGLQVTFCLHPKNISVKVPLEDIFLHSVSTVGRWKVLITIAAARASSPEVGSSMNIIEGLATSSTAIVSRLRCSVDNPLTPGNPTNALRKSGRVVLALVICGMKFLLQSSSNMEGKKCVGEFINREKSMLTSCKKSATPFLSGHLKPIDSKNSITFSRGPWYTIWPSEIRRMSSKSFPARARSRVVFPEDGGPKSKVATDAYLAKSIMVKLTHDSVIDCSSSRKEFLDICFRYIIGRSLRSEERAKICVLGLICKLC
ncbi:hypothetical protein IEQ34_020764 [Dendrobium chrysotoxum]|uniref:Uncharacterized protein n=1 Tax=Dendrobium chrysotoxum TaxID=161865 RepID=A0AAV7G1M9_DENCH|nr:hypothetical protein IEQ34_020764 [Dendrobium chrysotoxum]